MLLSISLKGIEHETRKDESTLDLGNRFGGVPSLIGGMQSYWNGSYACLEVDATGRVSRVLLTPYATRLRCSAGLRCRWDLIRSASSSICFIIPSAFLLSSSSSSFFLIALNFSSPALLFSSLHFLSHSFNLSLLCLSSYISRSLLLLSSKSTVAGFFPSMSTTSPPAGTK